MTKRSKQRSPRRWAAYENGKANIARRVLLSGKESEAIAKMYEHEIRKLCRKLRV